MPLPRLWARLAVATALASLAGSVIALAAPHRVYAGVATTLADTATAQDVVGLAVAPGLVLLAYGASRGHLRAWLGLLGFLGFTAYNGTIYCFSVPFGPLFLLWVAVWGLSLLTLVGCASTLPMPAVGRRFAHVAVRGPSALLIGVGLAFTTLWLLEIVPDLLAGRPSTSASTWNVPTNPVHVIDLGVFLPAVVAGGVLLLRRHPLGDAAAVGLLTVLGLTCLPIMLTPLVMAARDHGSAWSVLGPVGVVLLLVTLVTARLLHALQPSRETQS
ncbi:MAG: hypothetical protein M3Y71_03960 [Actinomycetota bacterium]|nr:hypothetical protein [Actinomycetota bacterium]